MDNTVWKKIMQDNVFMGMGTACPQGKQVYVKQVYTNSFVRRGSFASSWFIL